MPTIPAGFGLVTYTFSGSGVPTGAAVTIGFENDGVLSASAACTVAREAFEDNIMPVLVQNTGLDEVLVKLGPNATGPSAVQGSGVAGGDLSAQAPANVAYLVHKITDLGGRRGRGRWYLPGVDETQVDQAGTVLAGTVTSLQAGCDQYHTDMAVGGIPTCLLHEPEQVWVLVNGQPRRQSVGAAPAPTDMTGMLVSATVATQRRRQRR